MYYYSDGRNNGGNLELGELEAEVLGVIRELGEVTARDVLRVLYARREIAYTTVSTTMMRLHRKGLLKRRSLKSRGKVVYRYALRSDPKQQAYVESAVTRLVQAFGPDVVSAAVENSGEDEE